MSSCWPSRRPLGELMLWFCMLVAMSDGEMHQSEERMIKEAVVIFGLKDQYQQILARFDGGDDLDHKIIDTLLHDGRASVEKVAEAVGLSPTRHVRSR